MTIENVPNVPNKQMCQTIELKGNLRYHGAHLHFGSFKPTFQTKKFKIFNFQNNGVAPNSQLLSQNADVDSTF